MMQNTFSSNPLSPPSVIKQIFKMQHEQAEFIHHARKTVKNILRGNDPRLAIILGPCSIHDTKSALEYASKLKALSEEVSSKLFLVMRVHLEKPRTLHGWKGLIHDPLLDGSNQIAQGLEMARSLLLEIASLKLPAGMELLDPLAVHYIEDLISWGIIGARTAASQTHRNIASFVDMPVGFKNTTEGQILPAIQGALSAYFPQSFLSINQDGSICQIHSKGNSHTHLVLRGSNSGPNYDKSSVQEALVALDFHKLNNKIIIDCAHDNSRKDVAKQKEVFYSVLEQRLEGNNHIAGMMLESHLFEGNQPHSNDLKYAVSLTDPCLDWATTEQMIKECYKQLKLQEAIPLEILKTNLLKN